MYNCVFVWFNNAKNVYYPVSYQQLSEYSKSSVKSLFLNRKWFVRSCCILKYVHEFTSVFALKIYIYVLLYRYDKSSVWKSIVVNNILGIF